MNPVTNWGEQTVATHGPASSLQSEYCVPRQQLLLQKLREGIVTREEYEVLVAKDRKATSLDAQTKRRLAKAEKCSSGDEMTDIELDASLDQSLNQLYANSANWVKRGVGVDDFVAVRVLGQGGFGKVLLVRKKDTGEWFAMKSLRKKHLKQRNVVKQTKAERFILQVIRHPFVVHLCFAFQTKAKLYLLTPFYPGGDLHFCITQRREAAKARAKARVKAVGAVHTHATAATMGEATTTATALLGPANHADPDPEGRREWGLPMGQVRLYAAELLLALEHLHGHGIIYRDLKAENCLLDAEGHIHITDFGLSKAFSGRTASGGGQKTTTMVGTPGYTAPEILLRIPHDRLVVVVGITASAWKLCLKAATSSAIIRLLASIDDQTATAVTTGHLTNVTYYDLFQVDYWSFGVLVYFMVAGSLPFYHPNLQILAQMVVSTPITWPECSHTANSLMQGLLQRQPPIRQFFVDTIKDHAFWVEQRPAGNREAYPQRTRLDWGKVLAKQYTPMYKLPAPSSPDQLNVDTEHLQGVSIRADVSVDGTFDASSGGNDTFSGFSYNGRDSLYTSRSSGASHSKHGHGHGNVKRALEMLHKQHASVASEGDTSNSRSYGHGSLAGGRDGVLSTSAGMMSMALPPPLPIRVSSGSGAWIEGEEEFDDDDDDDDDGGRIPSNFDIAALGLSFDMDLSGVSLVDGADEDEDEIDDGESGGS